MGHSQLYFNSSVPRYHGMNDACGIVGYTEGAWGRGRGFSWLERRGGSRGGEALDDHNTKFGRSGEPYVVSFSAHVRSLTHTCKI